MSPDRSWSRADDELERLAQFIHRNFPAERISLAPKAGPRATAIVNVAMKLLLRAFGAGGAFPVRYTLTGKMRHYLNPTSADVNDEPLTFCKHRAYSLAEMVAKGVFTAQEAAKMRDAEECPRCAKAQRSLVTITDDDMAEARRRLQRMAASMESE